MDAQTLPKEERNVFDLWAEVYDVQSNPLLMLEERHIRPLLPALDGRDVLDIGCGTGRWLSILEQLRPSSLTGIDSSAEMLRHARRKVSKSTFLYQKDCSKIFSEDASKDFVLVSFMLSYLSDLSSFARECARVIRPGGYVLISDMHPRTAMERGWKRNFHYYEAEVALETHAWSLDEIVTIFEAEGLRVSTLIEPAFGEPERAIFESAGKLSELNELEMVPAIYILQLQKQVLSSSFSSSGMSDLELVNARYATGPAMWGEGTVSIKDDRIASIGSSTRVAGLTFDLSGYSLLPGLINAHDHLEFGIFPRLGRNVNDLPYRNFVEWAHEIHAIHSDMIQRYQSVSKSTRLWWGAIRNLLCGVTTVCHHNPFYPEFSTSDFPVRVVSKFGWSHSLTFDPALVNTFRATPHGTPFVLHAAEGVDLESHSEFSQLDSQGLIDARTVIVHGLALDANQVAILNERGASLIVCPTSNKFLFGAAISSNLLTSVRRSALGSDASITAEGDLLDEIRFAQLEIGLDASSIYAMVTSSPADILRLQDGAGTIVESGLADLIAVKGIYGSPDAALVSLTFDQIELVLLAGRVQMASPTIYTQLSDEIRSGMEPIEVAGHLRWLRAPLRRLFDSAESVLGQGTLQISGRQVRYAGAV